MLRSFQHQSYRNNLKQNLEGSTPLRGEATKPIRVAMVTKTTKMVFDICSRI